MMSAKPFWAILSLMTVLFAACHSNTGDEAAMDSKFLLADTIAYPVRIKNIDPNDEWATVRLKNLKNQKFVDDVFDAVYSGKATAFNYLSDEPMTIDKVKELEQRDDFKRDNVVELEFREAWWYNADKSVFKKKVLSILVAYAVFDDTGEMRMKAAFYIKTNNP
jgi:hypothetical protein